MAVQAGQGSATGGRAQHRQGLVSAVAGANRVGGGYGYGHWWLRATVVQAQ